MTGPKTPAQRQAAKRQRLRRSGGKQVLVTLDADRARKLGKLPGESDARRILWLIDVC